MRKIKLIGEIANTHDGDFNYLLEMLRVALEAKLDFVKIQMFTAKGLVTKSHSKYESYRRKEFSLDQWLEVSSFCENNNLKLIVEVFDMESLLTSRKMEVYGYKIHSTNLLDHELIDIVSKSGKTVFLSAGGSTIQELENAIHVIRNNGSGEVVLLNGFQNFPTSIGDTNLDRIKLLKEKFNTKIGLQDHISGEDYLAKIVPFMALCMGYEYVEKHYTLNRAVKGVDYYSSLNPDELIHLKQELDRSIELFGDRDFVFSAEEIKYRNNMKKKVVASKKISKDETITAAHLAYKRAEDDGILTDQINLILGKKINQDLSEDSTIKLEYFI